MNLVRVNATKVSVVLAYTLSALVVFIINDKVDWIAGFTLAIGTGLGGWVSSRVSVNKGDGFIKTFLVVMVIAMAIKLWFFT